MSWIDRHGTEHPLTVIGNNNCDARKPFLVTDSIEITDEEKLPIFGVAYGPLTHEAENMTISIGPLVCDPAVADQESNINEHVEALELQINDTITKIDIKHKEQREIYEHHKDEYESLNQKMNQDMKELEVRVNDSIAKIDIEHEELRTVYNQHKGDYETLNQKMIQVEVSLKCPTSNPNYRAIDNKCYYFETTHKSYDDAKQNCNGGKFTRGKLFEPKSLSSNKKVHTVAMGIKETNWWIGINDRTSEGSWVYDSDGSSVAFSIPWFSGKPNGGSSQNCLVYYSSEKKYISQLGDDPCSDTYGSICEQII